MGVCGRKPDKQATFSLINHKNKEDNKESEMSKKQEFLNYYLEAKSKSTYKSYKRGLALFEEFYGKSTDEAFEERRQDVASGDFQRNKRFSRELEKFHKWMLEQDYSINSARTNTLGIMQFFRYYGMPIVDVTFPTVITTKTFIPSIEQLRRCFQIASLRAKVILSLGLDLSWRISDFIKLKKSDIADLNQKPPIPIEKVTQKESVISSTFMSSESVELLKAYIPTLQKDNPYLFPSNRHKHLDDESVNKILKKLVKKAKIKIPQNKRFTFHSLRKRFLSTCYNNNIESDIAKLLVGKSIGKSMETYLGDVKLKNAFMTVREEKLSLSNGTIKSTMQAKDVEVAKLKREVQALRNVLFGLLGLNRKQIEQMVAKQLEEEGVTIRGDTGIIPIQQYVKTMTNEKLFQEFEKIQSKKQQKEYQKLLEETNSFNHKK